MLTSPNKTLPDFSPASVFRNFFYSRRISSADKPTITGYIKYERGLFIDNILKGFRSKLATGEVVDLENSTAIGIRSDRPTLDIASEINDIMLRNIKVSNKSIQYQEVKDVREQPVNVTITAGSQQYLPLYKVITLIATIVAGSVVFAINLLRSDYNYDSVVMNVLNTPTQHSTASIYSAPGSSICPVTKCVSEATSILSFDADAGDMVAPIKGAELK